MGFDCNSPLPRDTFDSGFEIDPEFLKTDNISPPYTNGNYNNYAGTLHVVKEMTEEHLHPHEEIVSGYSASAVIQGAQQLNAGVISQDRE